ncbi:MAG: hypothetical protein QOE93_412 [Actinomycetota bacterium]|jgi:hypothetical protein|nr:hypothetical protein [Actinomycetota bacterium]
MSGPDAFSAVWQPGSGTQWWRAGMSVGDLEAQDRAYFGQGLRITSLAVRDGRFAAVWSSGRGVVDLTTEDTAYFRGGLRLAFIELHDNPVGAYRYPWKGGDSFTAVPEREPPELGECRAANGVLVNVGDQVTQGQAIATSGNTGRSSSAHLHFQVQADSVDWGQSVAHTFGANCEVPTSGTSVTSDNST